MSARELPSRSVPKRIETPALPVRKAVSSALLGFACAVIVLIAFELLALHMWAAGCALFDNYLRRLIHSFESPVLTRASIILTWLGSTVALPIVVVVAAATLRFYRYGQRAWLPLAAIVLAELTTESTKLIVKRPRPAPWFGAPSDPWSFPSGHSLDSAACYLVCGAALLLLLRSPIWRAALALVCLALPVCIGLARIYLGVHWPTDVFAGWLAGACIAGGVIHRLKPN